MRPPATPTRASPPATRRPSSACRSRSRTSPRSPAGRSPTAPTVPPRGRARRASWSSSRCWPPASSSAAAPTRPSSARSPWPRTRATATAATPGTPAARPAAPPAAPRPRSPAACSRSPTPTTAAARSASPPPTAAWSASSPAAPACRAGRRTGWARWSRASITRTIADAAAVLDTIAGPDPLAWNNAIPPARPFAEEVAAEPGRLRIGLMAEAPLGIPTAPECVDAARDAAALLEELGHEVEEVEVPTISAELVPAFTVMATAGLAAYDGVDWDRVEPHNRHSYETATQGDQRLRLRGRGADAGAALAPRGRPLGPRLRRSAHPDLGDPAARSPAPCSRPSTPPPSRRPSTSSPRSSFAAYGNITGLPAISLPLYWSDEGLPVGTMLTGAPVRRGDPDPPRRPAGSGAALGRALAGRPQRLES